MVLGIFGAGGLGREVEIIANKINKIEHKWSEIIFIDDDSSITDVYGTTCMSLADAIKLNSLDLEVVVAVGEPATRQLLFDKLDSLGVKHATLIHPGVYIDHSTTIGKGSVLCEGVTITTHVTLEDNVYVHPHAIVGHDIHIGKHSMIGAGAVLGGHNTIGSMVYMGSLSGTKEELTIGDNVIISAGAIVFRDAEPGYILVGNPARPVRKNEGEGVFHRNTAK